MSLRPFLTSGFGLISGALLCYALLPDAPVVETSPTRPEPVRPAQSLGISQLEAELDNERARREELEDEIAALEGGLGPLQQALSQGVDGSDRLTTAEAEGDSDWSPPPISDVETDDSQRFDVSLLKRLGYPEHEIQRIENRWEAHMMERLVGLEEARRGLRLTPDYTRMRQELREDLGDDGYDVMLYATGESNRVRVSRVLGASPAALAGLKEGDVVLSYDEERVFKPMLLRDLTRARGAEASWWP